MDGAKLIAIDPRLSNTAAMADHWLPTWPGSETVLFLCWARMIMEKGLVDRDFVENQVNWQDWMKAVHSSEDCTYERFLELLLDEYVEYTPEYAAEECRIPVEQVIEVGEVVANAGTKLCTHVWRSAAIGNLGG